MNLMLHELKQICSDESRYVLAFAESRIGGRSENQDSYGWTDTKFGYLVTVCDGMGGGPGGKTASSIAVEQIIEGVKDGLDDQSPGAVIKKAIQRANLAIYNAAQEKQELKGMGSTATVLLINDQSAWVAHVGDSRVYQLRSGKKVFRTFDHSMVFDMVKKGVITEEQARLSAQSNIITRALGIKPSVQADLVELPYLSGDRFVLTSDGIHGAMPEAELIEKCFLYPSPSAVVDAIATEVDNIGHLAANGHDNLTVAVVKAKTSSKLKPKMTKRLKLIIGCLICISVISIVLNLMQYFGTEQHNASSEEILAESLAKAKEQDSIYVARIDSLEKALATQTEGIIKKINNN